MSYCPPAVVFSEIHADKRVDAASKAFGEAVVQRLLAFALFLMGARREDIARHLSIPLGTLFSLLTRIGQHGLPAIEDRRQRHSEFRSPARPPTRPLEVAAEKSGVVVDFGTSGATVSIPEQNQLQTKVFLLTLLQNGALSRSQVADLLGYSSTHVARMARQLAAGDVPALLDRRQGQQHDYRVTPQVKAEIVQQFAIDLITRGQTSGEAISAALEERCQIVVPPRTVRHHLARMGLPTIRHSLPQLLAAVKKTSKPSSSA
jgi:biotin operon repressor